MENKNITQDSSIMLDEAFEKGYELGLKIGEVIAHDDQPEIFDPDTLSEDERAFYDKGYDDGYEDGCVPFVPIGGRMENYVEAMDEKDGLVMKKGVYPNKPKKDIDDYSYEQGYDTGYADGHAEGYDEGFENGCAELEPTDDIGPSENKPQMCCKTSE